MKLNFLDRFFEKYSNIKFGENPPSGSRVFLCGQTVGQTLFEILPTRLKILRSVNNVHLCVFYGFQKKKTAGTKAFQNLSLPYHHCPQGFLQSPNSAEIFMKSFWQVHATSRLIVKSALLNFRSQIGFQDLFPLNYSNLKQRRTESTNFCGLVLRRAPSNRISITDNIAPSSRLKKYTIVPATAMKE